MRFLLVSKQFLKPL